MIAVLRWLLLPITLIYSLIVWIRNLLYDRGVLKSTTFSIPTIVIGNLAIGGTGKSPMTEYIVRLLKENYKIATLSRGYGRKTKGYRLVNKDSFATEVGDEPLQFKNKFPDITVAVSEDRCFGIEQLQYKNDLIILDDAYQHRKLKAGFSILLFDFNSLFEPIFLLPTGNFRDNFSATKRADLILITKCPKTLNETHKKHIEHLIRKHSLSPIFYTGIAYDHPKTRDEKTFHNELRNFDIILFCGIANPNPLVSYLRDLGNTIHLLQFQDHHNYTEKDFRKIEKLYHSVAIDQKILLTTEKDIQRICPEMFSNIPLYYIPIQLKSMDQQKETFDHFIFNYLNTHLNVN
ncbi:MULTISPECIES: tetraacyldisaccharide 4'-kinase [Sphingobacterium]|uniref:tetraacyldisaccharide 4'-kinase n=1 Tax=Sphingobacterium TaxID=28453 RepID=UPI0013D8EE99|nr:MULTISPECIES: tetraacyldisaccharide 4'-kinase [unclassified Sphingobacterium]